MLRTIHPGFVNIGLCFRWRAWIGHGCGAQEPPDG